MAGAAEDCKQKGIKFIPIVVETLGSWQREVEKQVKKLASAKAGGQEKVEALRQAFTRLSILLMKGNARINSKHNPNFSTAINVYGIHQ